MVSITLSYEEGLAATVKAAHQMMTNTERGWIGRDHGGQSGRALCERWAQAIYGQFFEEAACKYLGIYSSASLAGLSSGDPGGYGIRGTPWANGCLIVNRAELPKHNDTPFILVTGDWPTFKIAGWIYGKDAYRREWWKPDGKPPSLWVPQSALNKIETLPPAKPLTEIHGQGNAGNHTTPYA